ncbi:hypothetical protein LTR78_004641 [Recurvomyces mirabilis]|uniref:Uncharacterized protein n=1 Tax=Recurvomyces mirabilis TaxID=574656 RepID=A0AAE0WPJ0_9PEZI|nr:hypothetical protein LTR78_004641 [Recurvomyces mirabilis]KAK5152866.1 hypothetical protein LTS14_007973 [Recurvomyces mirabilis]
MNHYPSQPSEVSGYYYEAGTSQHHTNGQSHAQDELYDTFDQLEQKAHQQAANLDLQAIQSVDQSPFAPRVHAPFTGTTHSVAAASVGRLRTSRSHGGQGFGQERRTVRSPATESDSTYVSLHATSGQAGAPFPAFAPREPPIQSEDGGVTQRNFGPGSIVSEPTITAHCGLQGRRSRRGRSGLLQSPCDICQKPLRNPSDAQIGDATSRTAHGEMASAPRMTLNVI